MKSSSRKFFCHTDFANFTVRQHINFHYNFLHTKNVIVLTKILFLTQKDVFHKLHPHRIQLQFHVHHHSFLRNFHTNKIEEKSYFFTSIFNTQKHSHTLLCSKWAMEKKSMFVCSAQFQICSETYKKCPNFTDFVLTLDLNEDTEKSFVIVVRWEFTFSLKFAVLF